MAHELSSEGLAQAAQQTKERQRSKDKPRGRGDKRGPGRGEPPARPDARGVTPKFRQSYFTRSHESTRPEAPETNGQEAPKKSEYISFEEKTKTEMKNFLTSYVGNISHVYNEPGGRDILNAQPQAKDLMRVLLTNKEGGRINLGGSENSGNQISANIDKILDTPEGWVLAKTLLDQQTALQMFAAGFQIVSLPQGERDVMGKSLEGFVDRMYLEGEGKIHRMGRKAYTELKDHWKGYTIGGSAAALGSLGAITPPAAIAAALPLLYGLGVKGVQSAKEQGLTVETKMFTDGLATIQQNPELAAYMKATVGVDVKDFVIDGEKITHNPDRLPQSEVPIQGLLQDVFSNSVTRLRYLDDIGVPPSVRDIMPEQFLFAESNGQYERTGEWVNKMILDRFHQLQETHVPDTESLPPFKTDNFIPDIWGQSPESPFYGRMDGSEAKGPILDRLRGKDFPPPFDTNNVTWEKQDIWGQTTKSDFYGLMDEKEARFDKEKTDGERWDKWGQPPDHPFYGILDSNNLRDRSGNMINIPLLDESLKFADIDQFGQLRNYDDGTPNPFFGRMKADEYIHEEPALVYGAPPIVTEVDTKRYSQNNLEQTKRDVYGQPAESPFFGRVNGQRLSSDPNNIRGYTDKWGQTIDNPFFGRMEYPKIGMINADNFKSTDTYGRKPNDPEFGNRSDYGKDLDLFFRQNNPNKDKGRDINGRPPSDPLFCCDDRYIRQIDENLLTVDQWGQSRKNEDGEPNPYFGKIDKEKAMVRENLTLYRKARELVLSELTEKLIDRMDAHPKRSVSLVEELIAEREDGGKNREDRIKELTEKKDALGEDLGIISVDEKTIKDFQETVEHQIDSQLKAEMLIGSPEATKLTETVEKHRRGKIQANQRLDALQEEKYRLYIQRTEGLKFDKKTPDEVIEKKFKEIDARIDRLYEEREKPLEDALEKITRQLTDAETQLQNILSAEELNVPTEEINEEKAYIELTKTVRDDYAEITALITPSELANEDMETLLVQINRDYDDDPTSGGWPKSNNDNPRYRKQLQHAIIQARIVQEEQDPAFGRDHHQLHTLISDYRLRETQFLLLTPGQIEKLIEEQWTLNPRPGTRPDRAQIQVAQSEAKRIHEIRLKEMKRQKKLTEAKSERVDWQVEQIDDTLEDEQEKLTIVMTAMKNQGNILGMRTEFMADINTYIPVKSDGTAQMFAELSSTGQANYTKKESTYAIANADLPVGYFELMNTLFDYQARPDRAEYFNKITEILPPHQLYKILQENPEITIQGNNLNEILANLNKGIKGLEITSMDLRKVFVSIIDSLQNKALAENFALAT